MSILQKKINTSSPVSAQGKNYRQNGGYITLISVLVVGAVGIAIATSLVLFGLNSSRSSFALEQSSQAKSLANACVEYAFQQIKNSPSYVGTSGLTASGLGTCSYSVTSQGGQNRTLLAIGTVGTVVRKVQLIIVKVTPAITISTWQEVAHF